MAEAQMWVCVTEQGSDHDSSVMKMLPTCACLPHTKGKPKDHLPFYECCVGGVGVHACAHVCISHICGCDQWITMLATRVTRRNTELER